MISITIEGADTLVADLKGANGRIAVALVRALNRAIGSARTVMVREIARDIGLKQKDVRDALPLREATFTRPEATLAAGLKRIPLMDFRATGPEPSRGRGRGVSYRLQGGRSRIPSAFIARMQSGHRGVFARTKTSRLPIKELFGPSLGHVFAKYRALGLARAEEVFMKNFDHEFTFAAQQGGVEMGAQQDAGGAD
jgi:hypothetical protein